VPRGLPAKDRAAAFVKYADAIQRAALGALQTSGDRARSVLDSLGTGEGAFEPFVSKEATPGTEAAHARALELTRALEPSIIPLVRHPDPTIRIKALVLLAHGSSDGASVAVVQGVDDANESVQRVALSAIGKRATPRAIAAVSKLLSAHENWAMRVLAAQAMGRLGASGAGVDAVRALTTAATKDTYALVREAALDALATFDMSSAKQLATQMAASDPEPRVREAALAVSKR
jgi:HEAT repeat protein